MLEVQNNAARKTGDAEVIQHLPALMIRNALDRLNANQKWRGRTFSLPVNDCEAASLDPFLLASIRVH